MTSASSSHVWRAWASLNSLLILTDFADLQRPSSTSVDHPPPMAFEPSQQCLGEPKTLVMASGVGRRAHAIEEDSGKNWSVKVQFEWGLALGPRIKRISQSVSQEVEAEHRKEDEQPREEGAVDAVGPI